MKKITLLLLLLIIIIFSGCEASKDGEEPGSTTEELIEPQPQQPDAQDIDAAPATESEDEDIPELIGIISNSPLSATGVYNASERIADKYGINKIRHTTWSDSFSTIEFNLDRVYSFNIDKNINTVITNPTKLNMLELFTEAEWSLEEVYYIFCDPIFWDDQTLEDTLGLADFLLMADEVAMGPSLVRQAHAMGAKTFVHYSFERSLINPQYLNRINLMQEECERLGMEFVNAEALDPLEGKDDSISIPAANTFIAEDVPRMVELYGENTAFFSTNCILQQALIESVIEMGALYPGPCCPTPYHGFPEGLDVYKAFDPFYFPTAEDMVRVIGDELAKRGISGRFSTWPVDPNVMFVEVAVEYAIKRLNGEAPWEGVDVELLQQMMTDYAGVPVYLTPYIDSYPYRAEGEGNGKTYDNCLMVCMDYITFE